MEIIFVQNTESEKLRIKNNTKNSVDFVFFYQRSFSTLSTHFYTEKC